jgi:hypothetical protein
MVVIWLYFAILQKRLFEVSHTLERCHVPVYGFTRLLYTVVTLLLYRVSLSGLLYGLPLLDVPKIVTPGGRATTPKTQHTKADTRRRARLECKKLETYRNNYVILKPFDTS